MDRAIESWREYVIGDVLGHIDGVTFRKMFGGYGLYLDGTIFAIMPSDSTLYFKVDDTNRAQYESYDSEPFTFVKNKSAQTVTLSYWSVPEEVMEDRELIEEWVRQSAAISTQQQK
ncbi:TfoX/Sxy family protein [Candidatus Kaiserbacteria bacterium]|nr:TfoX/Sxy family protein [Candidatus Kaiserbacteria bacterium]